MPEWDRVPCDECETGESNKTMRSSEGIDWVVLNANFVWRDVPGRWRVARLRRVDTTGIRVQATQRPPPVAPEGPLATGSCRLAEAFSPPKRGGPRTAGVVWPIPFSPPLWGP